MRRTATAVAIVVLAAGCSSTDSAVVASAVLADAPSRVSSDSLPPETPRRFEIGLHCGVAWLPAHFNGAWWYTDEVEGDDMGWVPDEWRGAVDSNDPNPMDPTIEVEVFLSVDGMHLIATLNGRSVTYRRVAHEDRHTYCA